MLFKAYRFGLNPDYNAEMASADPTYAVEQYAWAWSSWMATTICNSKPRLSTV